MYDVIIIGSGPAGMAAAIYATRAKLSSVVIDQNYVGGGQVVDTYEIDNYPGLPGISGMDLGDKMREHAEKLGAQFITDLVVRTELTGPVKKVITEKNTYEAKTVIIASGATHRKLGVPGEEEFSGRGVSYCATCDGAFYRNKVTVVIGGGDVAVEDAIFLARACSKVYVVHRRDELRAAKVLQDNLLSLPNVEMCWSSAVTEILDHTPDGESIGKVASVMLKDLKTGDVKPLPVDGVFIAVGITPLSALVGDQLEMNEGGYIIADETGETSIPGVFAAGDVRNKQLRQIVTAVADGANAVTSVERYLLQAK